MDPAPSNFSKDSDGNISYLDTFDAWIKYPGNNIYSLLYDFDKLEKASDSLSEEDKIKARNYLARLRELYEEEQKMIKVSE